MELMMRINGAPIAKARHRSTRTGRTYWTQGKEQTAVQWEMIRQLPGGFIPMGGPLSVTITAAFKRPAKHFGTGRNAGTLRGSAPEHCLCSKDVDNIAKFYIDAMNRIVYDDDRQVIELAVRKIWSDGEGFVLIRVMEISVDHITLSHGDPAWRHISVVERSQNIVALNIEMKSKLCKIAYTGESHGCPVVGVEQSEGSMDLCRAESGVTEILFREYKGFQVFAASGGRYSIRVCLVKFP